MAEVTTLGQAGVIGRGQADVARLRERNRQRRMQRSLAFFGPLAVWLWWRQLTGDPVWDGIGTHVAPTLTRAKNSTRKSTARPATIATRRPASPSSRMAVVMRRTRSASWA